jgi:ABC-type nitrate/sulfonate/bicarbonate transport system substrate-binding protein
MELATGVAALRAAGRREGTRGPLGGHADTDQDLTSVVVVRADSAASSLADLAGRTVGVGAVDSPQLTLIQLFAASSRTWPAADGRGAHRRPEMTA